MLSTPVYVSICLPVYNRASQIEATIRSVLDNGYPHFELVIVDNASTDGTAELINAFEDPRIRILTNASTVPAAQNWNIALQNAKYELTMLLHSDDLLNRQFLSKAVDAYLHSNGDVPIIIGQAKIALGSNRSKIFPNFKDGATYAAGEEALLATMRECPHPSVQIIRKSCYENVGYYDSGYYVENLAEEIFGRIYTNFSFTFIEFVAVTLGTDEDVSKTKQIGSRSWTKPYFIDRYARMKWQHLGLIELDLGKRMRLYKQYVSRACSGIYYSVYQQGHRDLALRYARIMFALNWVHFFSLRHTIKLLIILMKIKI